ncbi:hypothetical protein GF369_01210 [Candidatus Peregrinibacteria bacterium]|nr:hypothetical protein [Candidatus Peregrinibacteria bacterium]
MKRRTFMKVAGASLAAVLLSPSDNPLNNSEQPNVSAVEKQNVCNESVEKIVGPYGTVVYKTEGMPHKKTVIAMKMIHQSGSFPQFRDDIDALHDELFMVGKNLVEAGLDYLGGEGFDPGEVTKQQLHNRGFGQARYAFIMIENHFNEDVYSFGYDNTRLLKEVYALLKRDKALEALRLNMERSRFMADAVRRKMNVINRSCVGIIAGGDHLEKEGQKEIRSFVDPVNFITLFEEKDVNVIVVEPRSYQEISSKIESLSTKR